MAPVYLAKCANCGTDASLKCTRCMDAPEYEPGDSVDIVYCNRECQREHWPNHKAYCRDLGQRKKLLRTAKILKAALLTYREVMYDVDLTKIELQDGVLYLHQHQRSITARSQRRLFPDHLTTNINHKEAALANNQCTLAMALLGRLTRKLLKGIASTVEVLDLHIGKPLIPTKLVPGPDSSDTPHTVLKVGRHFAAEAWILDTAGCQYGFQEVLVPIKKYFADNSCQILGEATTYDATETKDLDYFSTLPFMNRTKAQREDRKLDRQARLHFAVFVDKQVSMDVLDGSTVEFKDKVDSFVNDLKVHMVKLGN
ncbi:uncharacterized protein A1O9_12961 [Exophiala aquamarina CBS 119918]|uniref:MYND-type domain-containing protein n=1 Tax=Exophiala aquamarina CBS 119918 TaxID=1182545 RepID=A0A072NSZ0_9EURO|nr:uncharacterized protein A1O9_12961 [Exophiala aquamarina CBS 119918]KEF50984.1 hypothetical protein A1O9_12961 [Exophiala aquamarina CBS 119918]